MLVTPCFLVNSQMENLVKSELEKHMLTFQNECDYAGRACVVYDNSRLLYFPTVYISDLFRRFRGTCCFQL